MKKRIFTSIVALLAAALFMNTASACFISNLFKPHSDTRPAPSAQDQR